MAHTYSELRETFVCAVVCPKGGQDFFETTDEFCEVARSSATGFLFSGFIKSINVCRAFKPDIILGGSGLVAPLVSTLSGLFKTHSAIYLHGLDIVVENEIYKKIFLPQIRTIDLVIVNSQNTSKLAEQAGVLPDRISVVHPGIDIYEPQSEDRAEVDEWKLEEGIAKGPILLSVGRLIPRKGIADFVDKSFPSIVEEIPSVKLLIVGGEATDAIKKGSGELDRIKDAVNRHHLGDRVRLLGQVDDNILRKAFLAADIFVFPLVPVSGDVEGFGMVAAEAASYGIPTVAFNEGGVADAISDGESGYLISSGNYQAFTEKIVDMLTNTKPNEEEVQRFAAKFSWSRFGNNIREVIQDRLSDNLS